MSSACPPGRPPRPAVRAQARTAAHSLVRWSARRPAGPRAQPAARAPSAQTFIDASPAMICAVFQARRQTLCCT